MSFDILYDLESAQRAIPDMGFHWPDAKLLALGHDVQELYPEIQHWSPYLAAEGHLLYSSRTSRDPTVVSPRTSNDFLLFLRATLASGINQR